MMHQPTSENTLPDYRTVTRNRPRLRFDYSYLGTSLGALKLVEMISFAIATVTYCSCVMFKHCIIDEPDKNVHMNRTYMMLGYFFFMPASCLVGISVNLLMWSNIFHIVERFHKITWYIIEGIVCMVLQFITFAAAFISFIVYQVPGNYNRRDHALLLTLLFSLVAFLAFTQNIALVGKRITPEIPPQTSEI